MRGEIFRVQDAVNAPVKPLRHYKTFFLPGEREAHQSEGENDLRAFRYVVQHRPEEAKLFRNGTGGGVIFVADSGEAETLFADAASYFNSRENPHKEIINKPFWKDQMSLTELDAMLMKK